MKIRVKDGTQINHAGQVYAGGEELEVDAAGQARVWLARGWAEPVDGEAAASEPAAGDAAADADTSIQAAAEANATATPATAPAEPEAVATEPIADTELDGATRDELRAEAERLGVAKSGSKPDLLARIRAARAG